jgi:hydrogenase nickel incorporation protein HypA/HybF
MHELALCEAIIDTVNRRSDGRPVKRVDVRIGQFRQVVPDSLQFSWTLVTSGTDLDGCALVIEHVPAIIDCRTCGQQSRLKLPILLCEHCESSDVRLSQGEEFLIVSIERARELR